MSAFPPHKSSGSIPVEPITALKFLSDYLELAKSKPYLLPNAKLESSGPMAGSSNSSVTIHNLQRVEAGLKGEWLAPALDLEENNVPVVAGMDDGTNKGQDLADAEGEGWMDLDQYQREQSIEGGDIGDAPTDAARNGEIDSDLEVDDKGIDAGINGFGEQDGPPAAKRVKTKHTSTIKTTPKASDKPLDKEARKREKKERLKAQKKEKEAEKQKKSKQ